MESNLDFIKQAIELVAKTDRIEHLDGNKLLVIESEKKGFIRNHHIKVEIKRSSIDPNAALSITAKINGAVKTSEILFLDLEKTFNEIGLLDIKLERKLDILFYNKELIWEDNRLIIKEPDKQFKTNNRLTQGERFLDSNPKAGKYLILAYHTHIHESFPELINKVYIEIVNNEEILFLVKTGLTDPTFQLFFKAGIALKAAINNSKKLGLIQVVLMDPIKHEHIIFTIKKLEKMAKF